ncbi:5-formyltetrahydrofolate cyclo-ligase [Bacillaceae bacterium Marseille-Q3522]|nr:5-formyltetrahydrofolate cyclo-ligase [Bacillaceae bacterium Marseille-Q3522]
MREKSLARLQMKKRLAQISDVVYEEKSAKIANLLCKQQLWHDAAAIAVTISIKPEVNTFGIIRKAWEQHKTVVIPKCYPKERRMEFRSFTAFNQLETVYAGLFEPIIAKTISVPAENINLVIVPGLAFTEEGYRLGFGGGYYDFFLENYQGDTIALAFDMQIISSIPLESHDQPVQHIITEQRIITAGTS